MVKKLLKRKSVWIVFSLLLFVFVNNSSLFVKKSEQGPLLLAHRGLAQTFPMEGITGDTCTAERIFDPEHPFLENTIASMDAAFKAGADIVELDIHPTTDEQFAVFHDWTLDCRTDGSGVTRDFTLAELKSLDIGYGYTADGGRTYPFRGQGVGLLPSLAEVFDHFPDQQLLLHIKSNDPSEGQKLAEVLLSLPESRLNHISVYGGDEPIASIHEQLPTLRTMSKGTMKSCLIPYFAFGWTGHIPASCQNTQLHLPENIAPWIWGWPERFISRMNKVDTRVVLVGDGGDFSSGFDSLQDVERIPAGFTGVIWTNRIDLIAPYYGK